MLSPQDFLTKFARPFFAQPPLVGTVNSGFMPTPETPLSVDSSLAYTPPSPWRFWRGKATGPIQLKDLFGPPVGPPNPNTYRLDVHKPYPGGPDVMLRYDNRGTNDWI